MLRAAVAALLAALLMAAHSDAVYSYWGLTPIRARAALVLNSSRLGQGSHAAVWAGVSNPRATTWVQAGIENEGRGPHLYVEWANRARGIYHIQTWPARYGTVHSVRLHQQGELWRAEIDGHLTRWFDFPNPRRFAVVELLGHARAIAHINRKQVVAGR